MPQAISFGQQMVEGGSSFHQRASSVIQHNFRDDHVWKISTVPKAWNDMSLRTGKGTTWLLGSPAAHSHTELKGTRRFGWVKHIIVLNSIIQQKCIWALSSLSAHLPLQLLICTCQSFQANNAVKLKPKWSLELIY